MQVDMHYYGTYVLARVAGVKTESARTIAYAAQFVDNSTAREIDDHDDGGKIIAVPTAHHVGSIRNRDKNDQRFIWVPFHFFPGGEGVSWTDKLICHKDSDMAREMVSHHLSQCTRPYALELMGLTAHVYADTFSHYGFSGVSSRRNRVKGNSFKLGHSKEVVETALGKSLGEWFNKWGHQGGLLTNVRSAISNIGETYSGALGHGGTSNYPDLPFLRWEFEYEYPDLTNPEFCKRDNQVNFLECAEALHGMFAKFVEANDEHRDLDSFIKWEDLQATVKEIFATEGNKKDRIKMWQHAASHLMAEYIPAYDADDWNKQQQDFGKLADSDEGANLPIYRFFQAASYHRHYVLRDLLPSHGVVVV